MLAEQSDARVRHVSFELLARGRNLADKRGVPLTAVLLGDRVSDADLRELVARGADAVLYVDAPELKHFLIELHGACLLALVQERKPEILIAAATSTGRTLMPYLAIKAHAGLTADCTELDIDPESGDLLQTRPAIGGNIMATIHTPDRRPQMATVRPHSNRPAAPDPERRGTVERILPPESLPPSRIRRLGFVPDEGEKGLQDAERAVVVGRGLRKADNLPVIEELAATLDAAVGASRDAVDRGWLPYPRQIGLSGKTITPELYIGLGVSGAIQHLAGMQTAEHIIAINQDPDAQIFRVAELGIVGDLFEIAPVLTRKLREARAEMQRGARP
ncbi:MAG: electron transfer flavoprotein subunit alpha/FixB family protein [Lentisphaeria bacterium]|nr:electron transfer flavoprotein subunit alpha/FixB family protein [Lentisphaeria bacterium]